MVGRSGKPNNSRDWRVFKLGISWNTELQWKDSGKVFRSYLSSQIWYGLLCCELVGRGNFMFFPLPSAITLTMGDSSAVLRNRIKGFCIFTTAGCIKTKPLVAGSWNLGRFIEDNCDVSWIIRRLFIVVVKSTISLLMPSGFCRAPPKASISCFKEFCLVIYLASRWCWPFNQSLNVVMTSKHAKSLSNAARFVDCGSRPRSGLASEMVGKLPASGSPENAGR